MLSHFPVLGYRVRLRRPPFLYGIVAVAIALLGLSLLLAGTRRPAGRRRAARRGLRQSRRETAVAAHDRDDLLDQRGTARVYTASSLGSDTPAGSRHPGQPPMSVAKRSRTRPKRSKGSIKKIAGRATGSRRLQAEGRGDQVKGNTRQAGAKVKDAFRH